MDTTPATDSASLAADHGIDPHVYARRWSILAVLCLSLVIVIIGNTSLNVALPTLARELDASTSSLQWMVDSYALIFAGMLFTAGTLGDRFGRKGALQFGLVLFMAGAIFASMSDTSGQIIARASDHGSRRGVHHALDPVDPDQRLPRPRAHAGHRHLGRRVGCRRRHRADHVRACCSSTSGGARCSSSTCR